jgi:glycosyltransferase involved in cell wall biosynthesis
MAEKIRILFITGGLASGGKERQLSEVVKNLYSSKFLCGVIVLNSNQQYSQSVKSFCIYYKELKKRPTRLEPLFTIWKCFREFKPRVVHTWDTISSFYAFMPSMCYKIPLIDGSIRDSGVDRGVWFHFKRFFLKRADAVIANSNAGLKAYKINGHVNYNGINPKRFLAKVITDEFNIVMTANFSDYKDHLTFLKAAVFLLKDGVIDQAFLIGDGPNREKYMNWIEAEFPDLNRRIHFLGNVKDVENYLAMCNVGVLCSTTRYGEGISNSVLEYMAAGLIPIVTDIGGSSEIIENGINGFLINPGNENEIITLVKDIKNNNSLQERLIKNAGTTIKEKFSVEKNLELLTSFYTSLLN